jgi:hypothetical protein
MGPCGYRIPIQGARFRSASAQTALTKARAADTETMSAAFTATAALAFATGDIAPSTVH